MHTHINVTPSEAALIAAITSAVPRMSGEQLERMVEPTLEVRPPEIRAEILIAAHDLELKTPARFGEELDKLRRDRDAAAEAEADAEAKRLEVNNRIRKGHARSRAVKAEAKAAEEKKTTEAGPATDSAPAPDVSTHNAAPAGPSQPEPPAEAKAAEAKKTTEAGPATGSASAPDVSTRNAAPAAPSQPESRPVPPHDASRPTTSGGFKMPPTSRTSIAPNLHMPKGSEGGGNG